MSDIKTSWKNQSIEQSTIMSIADLQLRMQQVRTRFTRRNLLLYGYGVFNIVFGLFAATSERLHDYRVPVLLMIAAHLFVLWQVWKRFTPRDISLQASGQTALQFHRAEIERQHGAVNQAWLWYIAPFMPAFVWELSIWFARIQASAPDNSGLPLFAMVVVAAICFWSSVWLAFSRRASRLELELKRLAGIRAE